MRRQNPQIHDLAAQAPPETDSEGEEEWARSLSRSPSVVSSKDPTAIGRLRQAVTRVSAAASILQNISLPPSGAEKPAVVEESDQFRVPRTSVWIGHCPDQYASQPALERVFSSCGGVVCCTQRGARKYLILLSV